jgi:hypothetical protein
MTYEFVSIIIIDVMAIYDTCYRRDDEDDD